MKAPRKFQPGPPITSVDELVKLCRKGTWFYAWTGRPIHPGWILSQHLQEITGLMSRGKLRVAEVTPEWTDWARERRKRLESNEDWVRADILRLAEECHGMLDP